MSEPRGSAEQINMTCFTLTREVESLTWSVPHAAPLARTLLRIAGRLVIDTGAGGADPALWANTEAMALQWLKEALAPLGYDISPLPGSGRPEVTPASPLAEDGDQ